MTKLSRLLLVDCSLGSAQFQRSMGSGPLEGKHLNVLSAGLHQVDEIVGNRTVVPIDGTVMAQAKVMCQFIRQRICDTGG